MSTFAERREKRKARRAARRQSRKDKITSFRKDGNALKEKFGIGRSLSNRFDQRVGDGLQDLISGFTGVRTSNIPDIEQEVKTAREESRALRDNNKNFSAARASDTPNKQTTLVFPEQYFNEKGDTIGYKAKITEKVKANEDQWDEIDRNNKLEQKKQETGGFPNSIHFRSLPRKKLDTSEGWLARESERTAEGIVHVDEEVYDIFLYLPHNLGDAIKVTYEGAEGGMVDSFFARLFTFGDDDESVRELTGGTSFDMGEMMRMFQGMLPGGAIIQKATGAIANPMKFQSFTGLEFRDYNYKFTLKPSSSAEAKVIRHIIHAFKASTLPGTAGHNARIWTMPNEWLIKFQGPIKQWIDFPLQVVCESIQVDYGAGGAYALMEDGSPQAIDITLQFKETTQLSRQKYINKVSPYSASNDDRYPADGSTKVILDNFDSGQSDVKPDDSSSAESAAESGHELWPGHGEGPGDEWVKEQQKRLWENYKDWDE